MPDNKLHLPEHFGGAHVQQVAEELLKRRGQPLELYASRVKSAGALGLQVLVSTAKQWSQDEVGFRVLAASDAMRCTADALGISYKDLGFADDGAVS